MNEIEKRDGNLWINNHLFLLLCSCWLSPKQRQGRKEGGQKGGDQRHHGDLGVDGRAGRVLEGVADGIAGDGRLVGLGALAALVACLNVFLGIVPEAAGVGHKQGQQKAAGDIAQEETADGGRAADKAHGDGGDDGHQAGGNQLL